MGSAFPPASVAPLAWVAMAPWLLALRGAGAATALALAWGWTVLGAWVVGSWMPEAVATYFLQPRALGWAFFFGVSTAMAAVFYMGFALVYRRVAGRLDPRALPWVAAAAWVAAEWGRGRLFTAIAFVSNPWGLLGYSQLDWPVLVQIASVTGVYGVGFAIVAANAGLAELAAALARGDGLRPAAPIAHSAALPLAAIAGFGVLALREAPAPDATPPYGAVPVTIVQGHVSLGTRWRSEFYGQNLDVYLRATRDALQTRPGGIVFWPEGALTFFLDDEPDYTRAIAHVLAPFDAELVVGGPRQEAGAAPRYFNSIFVLSPAGAVTGRYDKQRLVPFSEYFPLRVDFLRRRFERVRVFTPGAPAPPPATRAGPVGLLVCNEAMLPELAAARVREGARYLAVPSNDTWIPTRRFADHLFDIVRLRAVEQRRFLVRASTSGPSAVVDPWGRVQTRSTPFERAVVQGWIEPREGRTPYARAGDLFAALCTASLPLALWRSRGRRPRSPA